MDNSHTKARLPFEFPRTARNAHLEMLQLKHVWFARVTGTKRAVLVAEKVDADHRTPHDDQQYLRNDFSTGYGTHLGT